MATIAPVWCVRCGDRPRSATPYLCDACAADPRTRDEVAQAEAACPRDVIGQRRMAIERFGWRGGWGVASLGRRYGPGACPMNPPELETIEVPDDTEFGRVTCGTVINRDDPTDVGVMVQFGPYRVLLTVTGALGLSGALASEAAYAATVAGMPEGRPS